MRRSPLPVAVLLLLVLAQPSAVVHPGCGPATLEPDPHPPPSPVPTAAPDERGNVKLVPVERRDGALRLGSAARLFAGSFVDEDFAVYERGERFLFRVDPEKARQTLTVVTGWPTRRPEEAP